MNNRIVAIILIAIGVIALAYQGITFTTRERTTDIGPIHVTHDERHTIPLGPIVGTVALVGGLVLLLVGPRKVA
jgi:hypothetical protein